VNYIFNDDAVANSRMLILFALAQRDAQEILEKLEVEINCAETAMTNARQILMNVCDDNDLEIIISFCYGNMDYRREEKLKELRTMVYACGGMITFDGSFSFIGDDRDKDIQYAICEDTKLMALNLKDGKLEIGDIWDGDNYINSERFIPDFELDRLVAYVKEQTDKRKALLREIHYQLNILFSNHWEKSDIEHLFEYIGNAVADNVVGISNYPDYKTEDIQNAIRIVLMEKVEREG
jgi:hypothetical protein